MTGDKLGPNLKFLTGKSISIFLVCGITIKGILIGFDQFMNLVVELPVQQLQAFRQGLLL